MSGRASLILLQNRLKNRDKLRKETPSSSSIVLVGDSLRDGYRVLDHRDDRLVLGVGEITEDMGRFVGTIPATA